jgi:hypothetical protein
MHEIDTSNRKKNIHHLWKENPSIGVCLVVLAGSFPVFVLTGQSFVFPFTRCRFGEVRLEEKANARQGDPPGQVWSKELIE